jgi:hypothetical protein
MRPPQLAASFILDLLRQLFIPSQQGVACQGEPNNGSAGKCVYADCIAMDAQTVMSKQPQRGRCHYGDSEG